jgi:hypothetical protein
MRSYGLDPVGQITLQYEQLAQLLRIFREFRVSIILTISFLAFSMGKCIKGHCSKHVPHLWQVFALNNISNTKSFKKDFINNTSIID